MTTRWEERWYGGGAGILAPPLALASGLFAAAVWTRGRLYDAGVLPCHRVPGLKVISVGNLNVGGTGKTPVVIHFVQRLLERGVRVAVLSRGYGRSLEEDLLLSPGADLPSAEDLGDEPRLIARRCPGAWVLVGADRVELAHRARREADAQVVVLDDGFSHRRLARDLDVVVVDEAVGFGNGHALPWGPLREPVSALERAGLLWLRASDSPRALPATTLPRVRARHRPSSLQAPGGGSLPLEFLSGREVLALSGIARPSSFRATLDALGARVLEHAAVGDHARFPIELLESLLERSQRLEVPILTTEKDAMRLPASYPVHVLGLEVAVEEGADVFEQALDGLVL